MKEKIVEIVLGAVEKINVSLEDKLDITDGLNCPLYKNNAMDSISLVTLISQVESDIEDEFNIQVILADEKAMSQKNSPFLTVGTLASYIINQLETVKNA